MRSVSVSVLALLALAAAGPAFGQKTISVIEKIAKQGDAEEAIAAANATTPPADPYHQALYRKFLEFANFEFNEMNDYTDTIFYSQRVQEAAVGENVLPQPVSSREIAPEFVAELDANRNRLMGVLDEGAAEYLPDAAGNATAYFDCWLEQQEEGFQQDDINTCRYFYLTEVAHLERAIAARNAVADAKEIVTLESDLLFEFDHYDLQDEAADKLAETAKIVMDAGATEVIIAGHTDSVGDQTYNMDLSQKRADTVRGYLVEQGMDEGKIITAAFGESDPVADNSTSEGRAQNRRVVILSRIEE